MRTGLLYKSWGIALATGLVASGAGAAVYVAAGDNGSVPSAYAVPDDMATDPSVAPELPGPPIALPSPVGPTPDVLLPSETTPPGDDTAAARQGIRANDSRTGTDGADADGRGAAESDPASGQKTARPAGGTKDTSTGGPADLRVGSYNVLSVSLDKTAGEQRPWRQRRDGVVRNILGEGVDVLGLQEVNPSPAFADRVVQGSTQLEDITRGLNAGGGDFAATDTEPTSSGADRILYDTRTVSLVSRGAYDFRAQDAASVTRGFAYATLRVKATGKKFFFVSTHLEASSSAVRQRQWTELIPQVKSLADSLPVIAVGDFNVQKMDKVACTYLPAMKAAGFGDVLNQECLVNPTRDVRAERLVNGWINSLNHLDRGIAEHAYDESKNKTGNSIDYIFATNSLRVKEWKVVLNYDPSTLRFRGVIPSDHNMVRATITLP